MAIKCHLCNGEDTFKSKTWHTCIKQHNEVQYVYPILKTNVKNLKENTDICIL
ncbi:rCG32176 [Rattus norvegicus]|uniref:RCG32176 n=1 Tax=Rattus norvegicus TaxID=10116 RepID=A6JXR1_RAT|nr:rCG32176 [Rattus norvegicus]